jgi:hypothetical protein
MLALEFDVKWKSDAVLNRTVAAYWLYTYCTPVGRLQLTRVNSSLYGNA